MPPALTALAADLAQDADHDRRSPAARACATTRLFLLHAQALRQKRGRVRDHRVPAFVIDLMRQDAVASLTRPRPD
ncbi:hypothetical protein [Litorisediminicola beolgyonensis]|uniref:Uncharacterized protein n=1 Tax=Litorisediminicola beolgyonensis TaxID=1173614 RepID=A0ABW3ZG92_9RHOB